MPSSAKNFFHKNRSQASLSFQDPHQTRPRQASPTNSPLPSPAYSPYSATSAASLIATASTPRDGDEDYRFHSPTNVDESLRSQFTIPTRSQSQRSPPPPPPPPPPAHYPPQPTSITTLTPPTNHHHISPSLADGEVAVRAAVDGNPDFYYRPPPPTAAPKDDRRRRFFRLGLSTKDPANNNSGGVNAPIIGRSISVRRKPTAPQTSTESGGRPIQQRWSAVIATPTSEEEEVEVDRVGLGVDSSRLGSRANLPGPPLPEKDPIPSSRPPSHQGFPVRGASLPGTAGNTTPLRPPLERQGSSSNPSWGNPVPSVPEYHSPPEAHYHRPQSHLPSPASATSTSGHPLLSRGPSEAFPSLYHEPTSRPASRQSFAPPSPLQPNPGREDHQPSHRVSLHPTHTTTGSMGPPTHQLPQRSGPNESASLNQPGVGNREVSSYPPYGPGSQGPNQASGPPPPAHFGGQLGINPPGTNYRGGPQSSPMAPQPSNDAGRTSPSSRSYDDMLNMDVAQVVAKYYELQDKYRKVKRYYFDKDNQVQQLQNTLAHQRLSQSRTSLDDNEYGARFSRLDGAINNLAFNIRRDWRAVPPWLAPSVNREAPSSPTKEMTAVGRACISRWLVDELLDRYFHPSLEPALSAHLKIVEKNLRRFAAPTPSEEEKDALMARISNWRLATVDGLQEMLSSPQAVDYRTSLTDVLVEKMTASLSMSLKEPSPPGLEGGVRMIVELAVGLAANIPLESRDVFVEYVAPGTPINETYMKIESGLPPLTNPGESLSDGSAGGGGGGEKGGDDDRIGVEGKDDRGGDDNVSVMSVASVGTSGGGGGGGGGGGSGSSTTGTTTKEQKKKSMFGGLMGGTKKAVGSGASTGGSAAPSQPPSQPIPPKEERVRFAAFMAVEVRGRSVLVRAPVYV